MSNIIKQQQETETTLAILRGEFIRMAKGKGHWGHKGRKGKRGGSLPSKGGKAAAVKRRKEVGAKPQPYDKRGEQYTQARVSKQTRKVLSDHIGENLTDKEIKTLEYRALKRSITIRETTGWGSSATISGDDLKHDYKITIDQLAGTLDTMGVSKFKRGRGPVYRD